MPKKYKELKFTDNFMFSNTLYNNPELCRELLELILDIPISRVEMVEPEKSVKTGSGSKGVRFDVYVRDESGTHFDIDMQVAREEDLPKRSRYYHRMLDAHQLREGDGYGSLKESYVIFICDKGAGIEKDRPVYYFEYICRDDPDIRLGDGSHIVFVNCCYSGGGISEELKNFFNYARTGTPTGDAGNFAHRLEEEVDQNRRNEEWEAAYMTFEEIVQIEVRKAMQQGMQQGWEQAIKYLGSLSVEEQKAILQNPGASMPKELCVAEKS